MKALQEDCVHHPDEPEPKELFKLNTHGGDMLEFLRTSHPACVRMWRHLETAEVRRCFSELSADCITINDGSVPAD